MYHICELQLDVRAGLMEDATDFKPFHPPLIEIPHPR